MGKGRTPNSFRNHAVFEWSEQKRAVVRSLADGNATQDAIAARHGCSARVIRKWLQEPNFKAEVERLAIEMTGIAIQIQERMRAATRHAVITRDQVLGRLCEIANASLGDFMDDNDHLDWRKARKAKKDHLITEVTVRRSKDGASRTTYKIERPTVALDLIAEIMGLKKQPGKNPVDAAREAWELAKGDDAFIGIDPDKLAEIYAQQFGVSKGDLVQENESGSVS